MKVLTYVDPIERRKFLKLLNKDNVGEFEYKPVNYNNVKYRNYIDKYFNTNRFFNINAPDYESFYDKIK